MKIKRVHVTATTLHQPLAVFIYTSSDAADCKQIFKEEFGLAASDTDCEMVRRVCDAVSSRAARLAATGIVALVRKINKLDNCSVAVDGSLYKKHPTFPKK